MTSEKTNGLELYPRSTAREAMSELDATMAGRIWVENRVDFSDPQHLISVATALTAGAGDLTVRFGSFTMGGIGTATFGAIILYQIFGWTKSKE